MSEPDLNDYLPSGSAPSFDNSSTTAALESLYDYFQYYTSKITGYFDYLSDTIKYSAQKIIDNIKNVLKNFYDNLVSLFKPLLDGIVTLLSSIESFIQSIQETIAYIAEPLDTSRISSTFNSTSFMTSYSNIVNFLNSFESSFANASEPSTYTIPIHLENLPSAYFGNLTTQYIDLGVIDPVKNILRTFMWAILTYSLVITIFDSISNYINAGGDES